MPIKHRILHIISNLLVAASALMTLYALLVSREGTLWAFTLFVDAVIFDLTYQLYPEVWK